MSSLTSTIVHKALVVKSDHLRLISDRQKGVKFPNSATADQLSHQWPTYIQSLQDTYRLRKRLLPGTSSWSTPPIGARHNTHLLFWFGWPHCHQTIKEDTTSRL